MKNQNNNTYSLAHTTWKCQYHIVFTPKYHRKIIYGALRAEIRKILRELCLRKDIEIIEAHAMPNHLHMLVRKRANEKVSSFMGYSIFYAQNNPRNLFRLCRLRREWGT